MTKGKNRKSRPSGVPGRPPAGPIAGKTAVFSTRITAETRAMLEREATVSQQSISQLAERILRAGLAARHEREQGGSSKALGYLVEILADHCAVTAGDKRFD